MLWLSLPSQVQVIEVPAGTATESGEKLLSRTEIAEMPMTGSPGSVSRSTATYATAINATTTATSTANTLRIVLRGFRRDRVLVASSGSISVLRFMSRAFVWIKCGRNSRHVHARTSSSSDQTSRVVLPNRRIARCAGADMLQGDDERCVEDVCGAVLLD